MSEYKYIEKLRNRIEMEKKEVESSILNNTEMKYEDYIFMKGLRTGVNVALNVFDDFFNLTVPAEEKIKNEEKQISLLEIKKY